jgi:tetratricopeptide (TPR) repeat protein
VENQLLRELDECINIRSQYQSVREHRIDSLRGRLAGSWNDSAYFEECGRLVEEYRSYDLDSQLYYTDERLRIASTPFEKQVSLLNYSEVMMRNGMYHESLEYMDSALSVPLNGVLYPYYYHLRRTLYGSMRDFAVSPRERDIYSRLTQQYRDSMMHIHPAGSFLHELVRADYLYEEQKYDSALHVLEAYERANYVEGEGEEAVFAVTRAQIYRALGDTEKEKHYLIISSLADLSGAIREYISLRDLALLLYKEGDIDRAFKYMECAVQDASDGSARVRSIEVGSTYPVVVEAYRRQVIRRQITLIALLVSIMMIVLLLIVMMAYITRQRRRLAELSARSTVYVGRYMEMSSLLIDRYDAWRKELKALAHAGKYDKITAALNSQRFTQEQLVYFYGNFDEAFLELFPDFVSDVQALLVPEAEIHIKDGERLNTDLRVLALIRLGITDSKQIAGFLRYSLSTIYNSRTRMRNLYNGKREDFEEKIATL